MQTLAYAMELNDKKNLTGFTDFTHDNNQDWQCTLKTCNSELLNQQPYWNYLDNLNRALLSKYRILRWISYYLLTSDQHQIYNYLIERKKLYVSRWHSI